MRGRGLGGLFLLIATRLSQVAYCTIGVAATSDDDSALSNVNKYNLQGKVLWPGENAVIYPAWLWSLPCFRQTVRASHWWDLNQIANVLQMSLQQRRKCSWCCCLTAVSAEPPGPSPMVPSFFTAFLQVHTCSKQLHPVLYIPRCDADIVMAEVKAWNGWGLCC